MTRFHEQGSGISLITDVMIIPAPLGVLNYVVAFSEDMMFISPRLGTQSLVCENW